MTDAESTKPAVLHDWDVSPTEAIALQQHLRGQVRIEPLLYPPTLVAGCDVSFDRDSEVVYAGVVVVRLPELTVVDRTAVTTTTRFPYIPGLLSFREAPALLQAWEQLRVAPDVVMLDGQGLAHPRRFGIACHVGLLLDMPALGCAKSILVGRYSALDELVGSWVPLVHRGETVGAAVRTKTRVSPVFISVGHRLNLPGAVELALRCVQARTASGPASAGAGVVSDAGAPIMTEGAQARFRIPEPTRLAHLLVNAARRGEPLDTALPAPRR